MEEQIQRLVIITEMLETKLPGLTKAECALLAAQLMSQTELDMIERHLNKMANPENFDG